MPAHGQKMHHNPANAMTQAIAEMFRCSESDLAHEVQELRKEIAALRNELKPVPSMIATGQHVLDEFRRMAPESLT